VQVAGRVQARGHRRVAGDLAGVDRTLGDRQLAAAEELAAADTGIGNRSCQFSGST